jgi:hypothetical protein
MKVFEPPARTSAATVARYGELALRIGPAEAAAEAWTRAGFGDEQTAAWLEARCFDPEAARALAELAIAPGQAAARTRDGGDYLDTIGYKVSEGALTARQGAARCMSSR